MSQFAVGSFDSKRGALQPASMPASDTAAETMLEWLLEGTTDVRGMAQALGVSLRDLGRWMGEHRHAQDVDGLIRLAEARTQMTLCRYRVVAATMLLRIASDESGSDLVRKACVDLLTINAGPHAARSRARGGERDGDADSPPSAMSPSSEQAIVNALQTMGEQRLL